MQGRPVLRHFSLLALATVVGAGCGSGSAGDVSPDTLPADPVPAEQVVVHLGSLIDAWSGWAVAADAPWTLVVDGREVGTEPVRPGARGEVRIPDWDVMYGPPAVPFAVPDTAQVVPPAMIGAVSVDVHAVPKSLGATGATWDPDTRAWTLALRRDLGLGEVVLDS